MIVWSKNRRHPIRRKRNCNRLVAIRNNWHVAFQSPLFWLAWVEPEAGLKHLHVNVVPASVFFASRSCGLQFGWRMSLQNEDNIYCKITKTKFWSASWVSSENNLNWGNSLCLQCAHLEGMAAGWLGFPSRVSLNENYSQRLGKKKERKKVTWIISDAL